MIVDKLKNLKDYKVFDEESTKKILDYIGSLNVDVPEGKYEIDGDDIYGLVQCYTTKDFGTAQLELHREYLDIQVLLHGKESIYYATENNLEVDKEYVHDIAFYKFKEELLSEINMEVGMFAIFMIDELHMPAIDNRSHKYDVKKVVIKVSKKCLI